MNLLDSAPPDMVTGDVNAIPKSGKITICFGMCGPGCCCWKWVCKDSCAHRFCIDHDACCAESFAGQLAVVQVFLVQNTIAMNAETATTLAIIKYRCKIVIEKKSLVVIEVLASYMLNI